MVNDLVRRRRASRALRACAAIAIAFACASSSASAGTDAGSRSFDKDWKFALANPASITDPTGAYANAMAPGFDDSSWRTLDVPHDWSNELPFTNGNGAEANSGYLQGGLGWYRKTFTVPASEAGKQISLDFDGVYEDSYVYVNGQLVGNQPYGYTGFAVDMTPQVVADGVTKNVVAVKVQNRLPGSRWYPGSGIYRHVHLVVTDPIHVKREGTYVTTPDLKSTYTSGDYATVNVKTTVLNQGGSASQAVGVLNRVKDASGAIVASTASSVVVGADEQTDSSDLRVDHPHLWSPDSPYLYTVETDLMVGGKVIDSVSSAMGIRWQEIDPNEGFSLNGKYMKLNGVDLHHDEGALGTAVNYDAYYRQLKIFKDMGVNFLRTSHNPPAPEVLDIADKLGIVVMEEAFDTWQTAKTTYDYSRFFTANGDKDLTEMVNAGKNHPSIILWSLGNEIGNSLTTLGVTTGKHLASIVHALDPTRPVTIGSNQYTRNLPVIGQPSGDSVELLDGVGLHYVNSITQDAMHRMFPTKFFLDSEVGSINNNRGSYFDPDAINTGDDWTPGQVASSGYGNTHSSFGTPMEASLKSNRDRKYLLGLAYWAGMDYQGEDYQQPGVFPRHVNNWGLVDTAGFPKDSYYLFKSQWTKAPMVHLLPMNWTDYKPGENVQVWAYANVDTVELFLNGQSLGVRKFDHKTTTDGREYLETTECSGDDRSWTTGNCPGSYTSPNGSSGKLHLIWNVPFAPGKLVAVATKDGQEVARDEVDTAGGADAVVLKPESTVIKADAQALSYVPVTVVDKDGVMVPLAANNIKFEVTGGGTLAGVDNGQNESGEPYHATTRRAYHGLALAIVRSDGSGRPITIKATSPGLLPSTTNVYPTNVTTGDVGVDQIAVRTPLGAAPALPSTVKVVAASGTSRTASVSWSALPTDASTITGPYTLTGTVSGSSLPATAIVSVYDVSGVATSSAVTGTGSAPVLPRTVRVLYTDGVERTKTVDWASISPAQYATAQTFSVQGTVAGVSTPATATVRVTDAVTPDQNLARSTSPAHPSAGASFSGAANTVPAGMLDGTTTSGGWSNGFAKPAGIWHVAAASAAHASDWVSVSWPQPQRFNKLVGYFTTSTTRTRPASVAVSTWNGTDWVPVTNQAVTWATASNQPSTITFDSVGASKVKLEMVSQFPRATNGHMQIAELQVIGDQITASSSAALSDLKVNGQTVAGFNAATTAYTVASNVYPPIVSATAAANGTVAVAMPTSLPGTATVTVTSEDGLQTKVYTVYIGETATTGQAGGTVPATLGLTLGAPASFGAFLPGVAKDYVAQTTATVISTAGDATLSVADPSPTATGHLVNAAFSLPSPLQASAGGPISAVGSSAAPATLRTWSNPVSNDPVTIAFTQHLGATDAVRTGSYSKTLTFTLSTTNP